MKWVLFTGTWRTADKEVEKDVREATREVIARGDGVLTGGATGVDYFAMDEAMKLNPSGKQLRVIIPAYLDDYIHDYHTNWRVPPITEKEIDELETVLRKIKAVNNGSLSEMPYKIITQEHYNLRHDEEIREAHEVYAFQINHSTGTQDTIDKARNAGLPIMVHKKYSL